MARVAFAGMPAGRDACQKPAAPEPFGPRIGAGKGFQCADDPRAVHEALRYAGPLGMLAP